MEHKKFIGVGRFSHKHKGFDILLKAFAKYCEKHNDGWTLEIVGEGPEQDMYEEIIKENDIGHRVTISPFTNNIQKHYADASVYVLSSRWEGFGLVLIEAMSHGLPIISSHLPVTKELLDRTGTSMFFNNEDIDDLAEKMEQMVYESNWQEISNQSFSHCQLFSVDSTMAKWTELF